MADMNGEHVEFPPAAEEPAPVANENAGPEGAEQAQQPIDPSKLSHDKDPESGLSPYQVFLIQAMAQRLGEIEMALVGNIESHPCIINAQARICEARWWIIDRLQRAGMPAPAEAQG